MVQIIDVYDAYNQQLRFLLSTRVMLITNKYSHLRRLAIINTNEFTKRAKQAPIQSVKNRYINKLDYYFRLK